MTVYFMCLSFEIILLLFDVLLRKSDEILKCYLWQFLPFLSVVILGRVDEKQVTLCDT